MLRHPRWSCGISLLLGLEEKDLQVIDLLSSRHGWESLFNLSGTDGACLGPDGNLWFTEPDQHRIGRLDVKDGTIEDYYLGDGIVPLDRNRPLRDRLHPPLERGGTAVRARRPDGLSGAVELLTVAALR